MLSQVSHSSDNLLKAMGTLDEVLPNELATKFREKLHSTVPRFVADVMATLQSTCHLDVSTLPADHVCWRTATESEYFGLVSALVADREHFTLLVESEIGGRPIATFQLSNPIACTHHVIDVVEIPSPKEGSPYQPGLEHVEFVIGDGTITSPWNNDVHQQTLESFRKKYPGVDWNTKALHKPVNPELSVKLTTSNGEVFSAKFHCLPLADVIAAEKGVS